MWFTAIRIASLHARAQVPQLATVVVVSFLCAMSVLLGGRAADRFAGEAAAKTDIVDVRKVIVEAPLRGPHISASSLEMITSRPDVAHAAPLIELGVPTPMAESSGRPPSAEGPAFITLQGIAESDPRFGPGRMLSGGIAGFSGQEVVLTRAVAAQLGITVESSTNLNLPLRRTFGGNQEALNLELKVVGIADEQGYRMFVTCAVANAIENWMMGRSFDPTQPLRESARAIVFARGLDDLQPLVRDHERQGFRLVHRLQDVVQLKGQQRLIYLVAMLSITGFLLAGLVGVVVLSLSSRRAELRRVAILKMNGLRFSFATTIVVVPKGIAAVVGFLGACLVAQLCSGPMALLISKTVGEGPSNAEMMTGTWVLAAAVFSLVPLLICESLAFRKSWVVAIRSALAGSP